MLGRRAFLAALGSSVVVSAVPVNVLASTNLSCREQLSQMLGRNFRLKSPAGDIVTAQLIEVDDGPDCPGLEQFSIVFDGDDLDDGLYNTYHPEMDGMTISLMPSEVPGSGHIRKRAYFSVFA
jgi:hypothetical protein